MTPSTRSVLGTLSKLRLAELARALSVPLGPSDTRDRQLEALLRHGIHLTDVLPRLGRDELREACAAHDLPTDVRARAELARRLLEAYAPGQSSPPLPGEGPAEPARLARGAVVLARHRRWLVTDVEPGADHDDMTRVSLVCLDDDAQGRTAEVLWELELGARVLAPEASGLGAPSRLDDPEALAAYLHALAWNTVTATDGRLFQSPFRAGIHLKDYQLAPLMKALELPRANLFIADDVGLGKTIEAGLIIQELLLRQRIDFVLVVCPAAVTTQWKAEMEARFGLRFEIYDRGFVARRRQERGFGVNPWATHSRFIVSYQTFRRPEHREALRALFPGDGRRLRSMLLLDEAHTVAPASGSRWPADSEITRAVRDLAPRFEHRLFLSATPHNGHSNSFAALLELLDPQRFLRGERVTDPARLVPVMVRRLKTDLPKGDFPTRTVQPIGVAGTFEEQLAMLLAEYTALAAPSKARGRLAFVTLQKRLLSSVYAFARTLEKHAEHRAAGAGGVAPAGASTEDDEDAPAEAADAREEADVAHESASLAAPTGHVAELLARMLDLASAHRLDPDAKVRALVAWMQRNQCPGVALGGGSRARWTDERLLIFTEYGHTKDYLLKLLRTAVAGTDRDDERIGVFDGGMSDDDRRAVSAAFTGNPAAYPLRVLVATDAAREGVNLQGKCRMLVHFDVPWNPARMEQRNGRIDRMKGAKEVTCAYFVYANRREDKVLHTLVEKTERIRTELGSLGAVVATRMAERLQKEGITDKTGAALEEDEAQEQLFAAPVANELERVRKGRDVQLEIAEARKRLDESRRRLLVRPELLREVVDVGLRLAGAEPLARAPSPKEEPELACFTVPPMPPAWEATLDTLRPPREKDEAPWEWRKRPLLRVTFTPPEELATPVVHLHLSHPFVERLLGRFRAQGFSAHDLSRVTVLRDPYASRVRVVGIGRLSLFGASAARLHEELVRVAGVWNEATDAVEVFAPDSRDEQEALADLDKILAEPRAPRHVEASRVLRAAPALFGSLWREIAKDADAQGQRARELLRRRGEDEAAALRAILARQLDHATELLEGQQLTLGFDEKALSPYEKAQLDRDREWLRRRREAIRAERETEPAAIEGSYRVELERSEPVALVVMWPETAG